MISFIDARSCLFWASSLSFLSWTSLFVFTKNSLNFSRNLFSLNMCCSVCFLVSILYSFSNLSLCFSKKSSPSCFSATICLSDTSMESSSDVVKYREVEVWFCGVMDAWFSGPSWCSLVKWGGASSSGGGRDGSMIWGSASSTSSSGFPALESSSISF